MPLGVVTAPAPCPKPRRWNGHGKKAAWGVVVAAVLGGLGYGTELLATARATVVVDTRIAHHDEEIRELRGMVARIAEQQSAMAVSLARIETKISFVAKELE